MSMSRMTVLRTNRLAHRFVRLSRQANATGIVDVVHETGYHKAAEILVSQGVEPSFKHKIPVEVYAPGIGISREGLYVNYDKPYLGGYGFIRLFLKVPRTSLVVSPELEQNGVTDVDYALNHHDGAITTGKLPPSVFYKVEIRGQTMTPAEYLKERGFEENVPRLPTVEEYEAWIRKNAEQFYLNEDKINDSVRGYERGSLQHKIELAAEMNE